MKTVLFCPGFGEGLKDRDYQSTIDAISKQGFDVKFIPIKWDDTVVKDWVAQLNLVYGQYDPQDVILAGFSFGAMTSFVAASQRNPGELWLLSLSPYFDIDINDLKEEDLKEVGIHRLNAFSDLDLAKLSKRISCKTKLFIGGIEVEKYPEMFSTSQSANKYIKDSDIIIVKNADHDVTDKNYIEAIVKSIK